MRGSAAVGTTGSAESPTAVASTGLVSRAGLSPLVERQDTAGPMTRTVADMARVLDAVVGYDSADPRTAATELVRVDGSYRNALDP